MRHPALIACAALACCQLRFGHAEAAPVGLLPVTGDPALARKLNAELVPRLARTGGPELVGPSKVQVRLHSAAGVADTIRTTRGQVVRAEQMLLDMKRRGAVREARHAINALVRVGGRYHSPRLTSRAHLVLARALLLKPAAPTAARSALRDALEISPDLSDGGLPPSVGQLLQKVRKEPARDNLPTVGELASLCKQADLSSLVWIAARPRGDEVEIRLLVYDQASHASSQQVKRRAARGRMLDEVEVMVSANVRTHGPTMATPLPTPRDPAPAASPRPWYRRWWIWAIAGAVVAGVSVTAVLTTRNGDRPGDLTLHLRF
jgi:hypothetical protein